MGASGALKIKLPTLVALSCVFLVSGCAVRRSRNQDYVFGVTGVVTGEDGTPLKDVDVILNLDAPVYEGIAPVRTKRLMAIDGTFVLMYISGSPSTKNTVTVQKN